MGGRKRKAAFQQLSMPLRPDSFHGPSSSPWWATPQAKLDSKDGAVISALGPATSASGSDSLLTFFATLWMLKQSLALLSPFHPDVINMQGRRPRRHEGIILCWKKFHVPRPFHLCGGSPLGLFSLDIWLTELVGSPCPRLFYSTVIVVEQVY